MNGFIVEDKKGESTTVQRANKYIREELLEGDKEVLKV